MEKEICRAEELNKETEQSIIEAFVSSEKSYNEFSDKFAGEMDLSKDNFTEWLQKLTIEDVPKQFIADYLEEAKALEDFKEVINEFADENYVGDIEGVLEIKVKESDFLKNIKELKKQIETL